jgi:hypothetical protein
MVLVDPTSLLTETALSRASPLPQGRCVDHGIGARHKTCGSGLAREGVGAFSILGRSFLIRLINQKTTF